MVFFAAAALLGGCVGKVGDAPSGSGGSSSSGTGNTPARTGTTRSPAAPATASSAASAATPARRRDHGRGRRRRHASAHTRGVAMTSQVPRLTNAQYDRMINDLLGVQTLKASSNVQPSTILATDQAGGLTDLGWSSYQSVGRHDRDAGHGGRHPEEELHGVHAHRRRQGVLARHHHQVRPQGVPAAADHRRDRALRQDRQPTARRSPPTGTARRDRADAALRVPGLAVVPHARRDRRDRGRRGELHAVQPRGRRSGSRSCCGARSRTTR